MPSRGVLVFVVTLLIVTGAYVSISGYASHPGSSETSTTSPSGNPSNGSGGITIGSDIVGGLQLQIELNGTTVGPGGALEAQVELFNTLSQNLSIIPAYSTGPNFTEWNQADFLCGINPLFGQAGFAVYAGRYASSNLSQAGSPLLLTPPLAFFCPNLNGGPVKGDDFGPESDSAVVSLNSSISRLGQPPDYTLSTRMQLNVTTEFGHSTPSVGTATGTVGNVTTTSTGTEFDTSCCFGAALSGYWTVPSGGAILPNGSDSLGNFNSSYFRHFLPGQYTIVAEDLWNQTVYAHFQVASSTDSPTYASISPGSYRVLQQDLTIHGAAACVPVEFSGPTRWLR
jgi:hypothetical protein